jgi:hypothetical protein
MKNKALLIWIFSVVFTLAFAYYQRTTGPTYPVRGKVDIAGQVIKYKLIRTHGGEDDAIIELKNVAESISGEIKYKRLGTNDEWTVVRMNREGLSLEASLPHQPPAGKLMYHMTLISGEKSVLLNDEPAVIRFKGDVPAWVLIPHIIFIFTAMLMSTRTGLEALIRGKYTYRYAWITLVTLFVAGLILGPVVQKYAFDAYWTGWPFGQDLTDNKTLVAFIFWAIAVWRLKKNPENRTWPIVAMLVLVVVFLIPHSMFGSELDYSTGNIETGK